MCMCKEETMKEILKKQVQQLVLETFQDHIQEYKHQTKADLKTLAKDLYDLDEFGGLLSILPAKELPTKQDYEEWVCEVYQVFFGIVI